MISADFVSSIEDSEEVVIDLLTADEQKFADAYRDGISGMRALDGIFDTAPAQFTFDIIRDTSLVAKKDDQIADGRHHAFPDIS